MSRLFTPAIAQLYEELYRSKGVKFMKVYNTTVSEMKLQFLLRF
jgi:hypothetical protein